MARTIRRSNTLPTWEADRLNRQARKAQKSNRDASGNKRQSNDDLHRSDVHDNEVQFYEMA